MSENVKTFILSLSAQALCAAAQNSRKFIGDTCVVECELATPRRPGFPPGITLMRYASDEEALTSLETDEREYLAAATFMVNQGDRVTHLESVITRVRTLAFKNRYLSGRRDNPNEFDVLEFERAVRAYYEAK